MRTAPPDLVHGAWTRRSVAINGGPHFETQHVLWLQAATCYADVRVPFHPGADARCFTGRSGWDEDGYRWTHAIDLDEADADGTKPDDVGSLTWEDDAVIERGMFPTVDGPVAYEEVWVRLPGDKGPFYALEAADGCLVRVGDHAIIVTDRRAAGGGFAAAYRRLEAGWWVTVAAIGDAATLPDPDAPPAGWCTVHKGTWQ